MANSRDLAICVTCGTQYDELLSDPPKDCKICDDPRQYVPGTGQSWTSLAKLDSQNFHNVWKPCDFDDRIAFIFSEPKEDAGDRDFVQESCGEGTKLKVGIGQRAIFIRTEHGNILWDLNPYIDEVFKKEVEEEGGLKAIVISHPHFFNTHLDWAETLDCPVYIAAEDKEWLCRSDNTTTPRRKFITSSTEKIVPGVTAIKCGGHFPGSMMLHWDNKIFHADTMLTTPSGIYHVDRLPGTISYTFMFSYPNLIPLPPDAVHGIWNAIQPFEFNMSFGAFAGQDVQDEKLKARVLESMKIFAGTAGWKDHPLLSITL